MSTSQARDNMVKQQIIPWDVSDMAVIEAFYRIPREKFVPQALKALAFCDCPLPLPCDQEMLPPKLEARILQSLTLRGHERILHIGSGSGHFSALLSALAHEVIAIENEEALFKMTQENLACAGIQNVSCFHADGSDGWLTLAPYDVIVLSGSLPQLPDLLCQQLNIEGRLFAVIGAFPQVMKAQLYTKHSHGFTEKTLFETTLPPLKHQICRTFQF